MPKQCSDYPDGKTFKTPPQAPSTKFGQLENSDPSTKPGAKQQPAPAFNPAN